MAARAESKDMYSWWWDSHISPKNSKWLLGNLTDMDSKVKAMIKIIEVDEDSFARRAEMYYKKRPELMKLVEEFYRAYRALAERYDHATGVIRQAHTTMAEAFPNQVPFFMPEDGPVNPGHDSDPRTPEMPVSLRGFLDPTALKKGTMGLSSDFLSGNFTNESDLVANRKGSKQLNGLGKARKGLNFQGMEGRDDLIQKNDKDQQQSQALTDSERLGRSETDIQALKEAVAKLEAEKEAGLLEYKKTLERLSKLESDFSQAKEDSKGLNERASKAETEVQKLKEALASVEAEREASLAQYQQCLERVSNLEVLVSRAEEDAGKFNDRASKAENEAVLLREELTRLKVEKEALLAKYMESLEKLANLENKLLLAEDYASDTSGRAERAEREVNTLRETITILTNDRQAAVLKYEQSLEKIANLENEIIIIQEEAKSLKAEIYDGVAKLKESEERCLLLDTSNKSLQSEVDSLGDKVGIQSEELSEKQKELGRLWTCVQEERMRFTEAEAAFQSLQNLHSKVQEELRSVAYELQKKVQLFKELETQKQHLEDEVQKVKDENESLSGINLAQSVSIQNMQGEMIGLKDGKQKLEQELELRIDQRNALQEEINCLKEELNGLSQRHQDMLRQIEFVGFDPDSFSSSVKELQNENSNLKESCQRNTTDFAALASKLGMMEKLAEKNKLLEDSLSCLNTELEEARGKVKELEESCQLLMGEKTMVATEKGALMSELQLTAENLEKVSQRNTLLENSLFDVNAELDMLRLKSKNLEDSCKLLNDQNSILVTEKELLVSELGLTHGKLEELCKTHAELEERYTYLEEERKCTLQSVEELQASLDAEKLDHANSNKLSQTRMADLGNQIHLLQEAGNHVREEFEEELDEAVNAQFEIFILRKCIQDLKENNSCLEKYCEKLLEASMLSDKLISELEQASLTQQDEIVVLSSHVKGLRMGLSHLLYSVEANGGPAVEGCSYEDERVIHLIQEKLNDIKASMCDGWDENQELVIQKSVLLAVIGQLKHDVTDLNAVILTFKQEIGNRNKEILLQQREMQTLLESNEELILKVSEGNMREAALVTEVGSLREKLLNLQVAYDNLQKENCKVVEEHEESEEKVRALSTELQIGREEIKLWETVAATFFTELQSSSVREALIKEKFAELLKAYETLEDESYSKCLDIAQLRDRVGALEGENSEIKARLAADLSAIMSLKDSVASLEKHAVSSKKIHQMNNEEKEVVGRSTNSSEPQSVGFVNLHEVQARIQDVEKAVIQLKQHAEEESKVRSDLDSALRQIEALKSQSSSRPGSGRFSRRLTSQSREDLYNGSADGRKQKPSPDGSELGEELLMKDIVLDQASDCSSYGRNRKIMGSDDQILELWENIDQSGSIDLTVGKSYKATPAVPNKYSHLEAVKENKSGRPSVESLVERELGVDEPLSSKRFVNPQLVDTRKKTLERLASDVQKLTNLQITVQDLKQKLMTNESTSSKGKAVECDGVKEQLLESEQTILKLFEYSAKVMKNIENSSSASSSRSSDAPSASSDPSDAASARRKKSMEHARRISEKIGRLQLDVQKVQFFLMKLDYNKASKVGGGTRIIERNTRVLLKDYLYGASKTPRRRKKTHFCGCVQPATKGSD